MGNSYFPSVERKGRLIWGRSGWLEISRCFNLIEKFLQSMRESNVGRQLLKPREVSSYSLARGTKFKGEILVKWLKVNPFGASKAELR